jgi:hypothetical protein
MRESRTSGSVEGVLSNEHPYSDFGSMRYAACCTLFVISGSEMSQSFSARSGSSA